MKYIILSLSLLFFFKASSQETSYYLDISSSKISYKANEALLASLESKLKSVSSKTGAVKLTTALRKSSSKKIEGIEIRNLGNNSISFKIENQLVAEDTVLVFDVSSSVNNEKDVDLAIIENFVKSKDYIDVLIPMIKKYNSMNTNCVKLTNNLKLFKAMEKFDKAFGLLGVAKNGNYCTKELEALEKEIIKLYSQKECDKLLFEAKTLIASGTEYNINKSVTILLKIPPTPECREDALKVIEELNSKTNNTITKDKIKKYGDVVASSNLDQWYSLFLNN